MSKFFRVTPEVGVQDTYIRRYQAPSTTILVKVTRLEKAPESRWTLALTAEGEVYWLDCHGVCYGGLGYLVKEAKERFMVLAGDVLPSGASPVGQLFRSSALDGLGHSEEYAGQALTTDLEEARGWAKVSRQGGKSFVRIINLDNPAWVDTGE